MTLFKRDFLLQIITFVFCLFLNSCSSLTLENELFNSLQEKCNFQKECNISLHKITSFEWDRAYFFEKNNINYNYITPSNDKIMVKYNLAHQKGVVQKSYTIYPTNLNQIKLFNPQMDNN